MNLSIVREIVHQENYLKKEGLWYSYKQVQPEIKLPVQKKVETFLGYVSGSLCLSSM